MRGNVSADWLTRPPQGKLPAVGTVALIANSAFGLIQFRGPLISSLSMDGHRVLALSPSFTEAEESKLRSFGAEPITMISNPRTASPLVVFSEVVRLAMLLRRHKPDIVIAYFVRQSIIATLASLLAGVRYRFLSIEGLGFFLRPGQKRTFGQKVVGAITACLLRRCIAHSDGTFFLNRDDSRVLLKGRLEAKIIYIKAVGVDLDFYYEAPIPQAEKSFIFLGRLLFEKGLPDYVAAAKSVHDIYPKTQFFIAGEGDGTSRSVCDETMRQWVAEGSVIWLGHIADVRSVIARATALVLPSFGEGAPRSVQEAMAMGRAVITTSASGCDAMIEHGIHGLQVPPGDPSALASAIVTLIESPDLAGKYGKAGRKFAEQHFDSAAIAQTIKENIYRRIP